MVSHSVNYLTLLHVRFTAGDQVLPADMDEDFFPKCLQTAIFFSLYYTLSSCFMFLVRQNAHFSLSHATRAAS